MIYLYLYFSGLKEEEKGKSPFIWWTEKRSKSCEILLFWSSPRNYSIIYKLWDAHLFWSEKKFFHHMTSLINHLAEKEHSLKAIKEHIYKAGRQVIQPTSKLIFLYNLCEILEMPTMVKFKKTWLLKKGTRSFKFRIPRRYLQKSNSVWWIQKAL